MFVNWPINLFDLLIVLFLATGLVVGRKRGLTVELPSLLKWVSLVLVCTLIYQPAGDVIAAAGFFDPLTCYLFAYGGTALAMFLVFSIIERRLRPKLAGSDIFGHSEYYLGMGSGLVRFLCMLLVVLAFLHAKAFSESDLEAMEKFQEDAYGSQVFPTLHSFQVQVFQHSLAGSILDRHLGFLLIRPTISSSPIVAPGTYPARAIQTAGSK